MKRITHLVSFFAIFAICLSHTAIAGAQQLPSNVLPGLIISELQTGGLVGSTEDGQQEFVELYNSYDTPYDLNGVQLEYLSASHTGEGISTRTLTRLSGVAAPKSFIVVSYPDYIPDADFNFTLPSSPNPSGLLARTGGHVRLVSAAGKTNDLISWGTATDIAPWWRSPELGAGMSVQRILPGDSQYTTGLTYLPPSKNITPGTEPPASTLPPEEPGIPPACTVVSISEILPNAAGTDAGKEFIELHNSTATPLSLLDCQLELDGKSFALPDEVLGPNSYRAFYDTETGFSLPNTTAATVRLVSNSSNQAVHYADNMADNTSWSFVAGMWQLTTIVTPNAANVPSVPGVDGNANPAQPVPCASDKERNPETGRCRNISVATAPVICKVGQERNPETGRCRLTTVATATTTACRINQERNPETNRCRAVQAVNTAKPCPSGQERNTLTNRCRKVAGGTVGQMATVKDLKGDTLATNYRWWIAGGLILAVAAYGVYEWRRDIANTLHRMKISLPHKLKFRIRRR